MYDILTNYRSIHLGRSLIKVIQFEINKKCFFFSLQDFFHFSLLYLPFLQLIVSLFISMSLQDLFLSFPHHSLIYNILLVRVSFFKDTYQHVWRQKRKKWTSTTKWNKYKIKLYPSIPIKKKKIPWSTFTKCLEFISFELTSVQQFQTQCCGFINFSSAYNKDLRNLKPSHIFSPLFDIYARECRRSQGKVNAVANLVKLWSLKVRCIPTKGERSQVDDVDR